MRELGCAEARDLASDLIDGELSCDLAAAVEHHVANCPTCPALYRAMVSVHSRLLAQRRSAGPSPG
ncbi:MAG: zf-HC2 domain-containing protein [Candidatus Dormibacteria bacterium]